MSWVQNVQAVQVVQNVWNDVNYLNGWNSNEHRSIAFDPEGSSLDRCLPVNNPGYGSPKSRTVLSYSSFFFCAWERSLRSRISSAAFSRPSPWGKSDENRI